MSRVLTMALAAFYGVATILMAATIYRHTDRSWLDIGHALALWLVSVVLPGLWTRTLVKKLRQHGVPLQDLQVAIVMPSSCAVLTALIALQFVRR